ncbi:MAG TPA: hypothetical protein VGJ92_11530 [Methanocella sp.]|jgi:hypothetical protein
MASLAEYTKSSGDILRPHGDLDVLAYYGMIAPKLETYLHGRELATRTWLQQGRIRSVVKRGSQGPPLYIPQLVRAVTPQMINARVKYAHLEEGRNVLSPDQALVWYYFPPRRMVEFHYATNREGEGREINRVCYDLGRGRGVTAEDAIEVAALLTQAATDDDQVRNLTRGKPFVSWTGNSFNLLLALKKIQPAGFYSDQIEYSGRGHTLTDRLIDLVTKEASVPVTGGHTRLPGHVTVDPSQTPSGHLCRVPLGSLNMSDSTTIEGVSVPLTQDMLRREEVARLQHYTPVKVIDELDELTRRLP